MNAKDLLHKLLDYAYLWSKPERLKSKPSQIRLKQIEVLLDALELSKKSVNPLVQAKYFVSGRKKEWNRTQHLKKMSNIQYVRSGEFLRDRPYEVYTELGEKAKAKIRELYTKPPESRMNREVDISWMFNHLLNFRQKAHELAFPDSGIMEGFPVGLIYGQFLTGEVRSDLNAKLATIDQTLWEILDPDQREIEEEHLAREFDYPLVDLEKIDHEWSMGNF